MEYRIIFNVLELGTQSVYENLFLQFMPTPPGRFCIRLQEYAKGGWQVFLLFPYNALIMKE